MLQVTRWLYHCWYFSQSTIIVVTERRSRSPVLDDK